MQLAVVLCKVALALQSGTPDAATAFKNLTSCAVIRTSDCSRLVMACYLGQPQRHLPVLLPVKGKTATSCHSPTQALQSSAQLNCMLPRSTVDRGWLAIALRIAAGGARCVLGTLCWAFCRAKGACGRNGVVCVAHRRQCLFLPGARVLFMFAVFVCSPHGK